MTKMEGQKAKKFKVHSQRRELRNKTKTDKRIMILFRRILDKTFEGLSANDMIK